MTHPAIREIHERLDDLDGAALISMACGLMIENQSDLAIASGISPTTITQIKRGKRATRSQRAAIYWAVINRTLRRHT